MLVSLTVDSVGTMVHCGVVEFDMAWGLAGGLVLGAWDRVEGWAVHTRREQGREKFEDWRPSLLGLTFPSSRAVAGTLTTAARERIAL